MGFEPAKKAAARCRDRVDHCRRTDLCHEGGDQRVQAMKGLLLRNDRGVALLIVLLVTALLVALVFEFAYATRVSLRAAVNFRDSQRAYYLARSGVNFAGRFLVEYKKNGKLQDHLEQDWLPVPFVSG